MRESALDKLKIKERKRGLKRKAKASKKEHVERESETCLFNWSNLH